MLGVFLSWIGTLIVTFGSIGIAAHYDATLNAFAERSNLEVYLLFALPIIIYVLMAVCSVLIYKFGATNKLKKSAIIVPALITLAVFLLGVYHRFWPFPIIQNGIFYAFTRYYTYLLLQVFPLTSLLAVLLRQRKREKSCTLNVSDTREYTTASDFLDDDKERYVDAAELNADGKACNMETAELNTVGKVRYIDAADLDIDGSVMAIIHKDYELKLIGTTFYVCMITPEDIEFAAEMKDTYGIHFVTAKSDDDWERPFFTVPWLSIFAKYENGVFALIGQKEHHNVYYIDDSRNAYILGCNFDQFIAALRAGEFEEMNRSKVPYFGIDFYDSKEAAAEDYIFLEE